MSFGVAIVLLGAVQGLVVALPDAGWPSWLWRPTGWAWALIAPLSIVVVIFAIELLPGVADGLTWLALIAVPLLAAAALGWAMRGARPIYALAAIPLFALAWALEGSLSGDATALALTALSCVTLGRLVAGLAPAILIKIGLIVTAIVDTTLIVTEKLQAPNDVLNAAAPAPTCTCPSSNWSSSARPRWAMATSSSPACSARSWRSSGATPRSRRSRRSRSRASWTSSSSSPTRCRRPCRWRWR